MSTSSRTPFWKNWVLAAVLGPLEQGFRNVEAAEEPRQFRQDRRVVEGELVLEKRARVPGGLQGGEFRVAARPKMLGHAPGGPGGFVEIGKGVAGGLILPVTGLKSAFFL